MHLFLLSFFYLFSRHGLIPESDLLLIHIVIINLQIIRQTIVLRIQRIDYFFIYFLRHNP